jgi:hypothetical protein
MWKKLKCVARDAVFGVLSVRVRVKSTRTNASCFGQLTERREPKTRFEIAPVLAWTANLAILAAVIMAMSK